MLSRAAYPTPPNTRSLPEPSPDIELDSHAIEGAVNLRLDREALRRLVSGAWPLTPKLKRIHVQPTFPSDHHFHRRGNRTARLGSDSAQATSHADAGWSARMSAAAYLSRQCLPALDPTDPRGAG